MSRRRWLGGIALALALAGVGTAHAQRVATVKPPTKEQLAVLVAELAGADPEVAARAAASLGRAPGAPAHDALLDALAMGVPPAVAPSALAALTLHAAPADVVTIVRYANHRNPSVRSAALGALALYPDPAARTRIVRGLHDGTSTVRAAAAAAAAAGRVRSAVDSLVALLAKGELAAGQALAALADADLAFKLADQHGKIPSEVLVPTLGLVAQRTDLAEPVRVQLVRAIAKIGGRVAIDTLTDYVAKTPKSPPRTSRDEAEAFLQATGGAK